MKSKYNSFCVKCHQRIRIGDEITRDPELGKWVHESCNFGNFVSSVDLDSLIQQAEANSVRDDGECVSIPDNNFVPSHYQQDIGSFVEDPVAFCESRGEPIKINLCVDAAPGSGKTTTIVWALKFTKPTDRVAFVAFSKPIADEIKRRQNLGLIPEHIHVSTLHSLGRSVIMKLEDKPEVDRDKVSIIMDDFWPISRKSGVDPYTRRENKVRRSIMRKLVSYAKNTLVDYENQNAVLEMCERYGIEIDDLGYEAVYRLPDVMKACLANLDVIDFDDMIWLPIVHNRLKLHMEKFDIIFVDERQDLTPAQIEFLMNSLQPKTGRIIAVGDPRQSLFAFTGADMRVVREMAERLDAKELPLSISYRCSKAVVELAKTIYPEIEPFENAQEGEVIGWDKENGFNDKMMNYPEFMNSVKTGDMVICRTNAPLVKPAFTMIRRGNKAIIKGQDIGEDLINFIERFNADDLHHLESLITEWTDKKHSSLIENGKELAAEAVLDKYETIMAIAQQCRTVMELIEKLRMLFSNKVQGVVFSSVHRAKGLEADSIYILHRELLPHPKATQEWEIEQEKNCEYVAYTRSKNKLIFVKDEE